MNTLELVVTRPDGVQITRKYSLEDENVIFSNDWASIIDELNDNVND